MSQTITTVDPFRALRRAATLTSSVSSDFDLNPDVVLPKNRKLRPAGVLVPVVEMQDGLHVILTKRSSALKHHPGQIAFPGGKVDDGDADSVAAALREAQEEIGLPTSNVEVIGQLPCHETVTSFQITPVLGAVLKDFEWRAEPGEVEEIFTTPLAHLSDPQNYQIQSRLWRGTWRRYYAVPYGPYYIWGATARILRGLAERMSS